MQSAVLYLKVSVLFFPSLEFNTETTSLFSSSPLQTTEVFSRVTPRQRLLLCKPVHTGPNLTPTLGCSPVVLPCARPITSLSFPPEHCPAEDAADVTQRSTTSCPATQVLLDAQLRGKSHPAPSALQSSTGSPREHLCSSSHHEHAAVSPLLGTSPHLGPLLGPSHQAERLCHHPRALPLISRDHSTHWEPRGRTALQLCLTDNNDLWR